jgi:sec-independent protein translocase protein TatA
VSLDNPLHLAVLLLIVLLLFGAKRLPEMGRSLGSGMRGFRDALTGDRAADDVPGEEQRIQINHNGGTP